MCLVILAHHCHPRYPLVLAANRDEFYARATEPARFWPQQPSLLAGRDREQGGTWMGITRRGRFAAITNFRDPSRTAPAPRSRGELTLDFLTGDAAPDAYLHSITGSAAEYAGFNLLVGDASTLWYFNNGHPGNNTPQQLHPGIYGLSNARLDTPWPKVALGRERLAHVLDGVEPDHDALFQVVADRSLPDPEHLHPLGLDQEMDQLLSAQFITANGYGYGTRSSTTLWTGGDGSAHWRELSFDQAGEVVDTREEVFSIDRRAA